MDVAAAAAAAAAVAAAAACDFTNLATHKGSIWFTPEHSLGSRCVEVKFYAGA